MPRETERYIRLPVPGVRESDYKIVATITVSESQRIKGLLGKPISGGGGTRVVVYLFDKNNWTMDKAKAWAARHRVKESVGGEWQIEWKQSYVDSLPNTSFVDCSNRLLPIYDHRGRLDAVQVEMAVVEAGQYELPDWAESRLTSAAREFLLQESVWTRAYINDLPDSAFIHIEEGGLRHLPVKDRSGRLDYPHVKAALSQAPQLKDKNGKPFQLPSAAKEKLERSAMEVGMKQYAKDMKETHVTEVIESAAINAKVDRHGNFIRGVKLLGLESKGRDGKVRRRYTTRALREFAGMLEGKNFYVNHPPTHDPDKVRDVQELGGKIRNVRVQEDGGFADLQVAKNQSWLYDLVESVPDAVGMSLNGWGWGRYVDSIEQIEHAKTALSCDIVTEPGSTINLFESQRDTEGDGEMRIDELTITQLREQRPDIVAEISKEVKETMGETERIKELETKVAESEKRIKESKEENDKLKAAEAAREKKELAHSLMESMELPKELRTDVLNETLLACKDEAGMKKVIEDRLGIWNKATGRPESSERGPMDGEGNKPLKFKDADAAVQHVAESM